MEQAKYFARKGKYDDPEYVPDVSDSGDRVAYSRSKKAWTHEEEATLAQIVIEDGCRRWTIIAKLMTERMGGAYKYKPKQVRERFVNYVDPDLNRGPWSKTEDIKLLELITAIGIRIVVTATLSFLNKTPRNVKLRISILHIRYSKLVKIKNRRIHP